MNSVFDKFRGPSNNIFGILQEYRRIQNNPSEIGQILLNAGKISQAQFDEISRMNNPRQIGEYLLQNNPAFKDMYNRNNFAKL